MTTWMGLENMTLSERSQLQKTPLIWNDQNRQVHRNTSRLVVAGAGERGEGSVAANGCGAFFFSFFFWVIKTFWKYITVITVQPSEILKTKQRITSRKKHNYIFRKKTQLHFLCTGGRGLNYSYTWHSTDGPAGSVTRAHRCGRWASSA